MLNLPRSKEGIPYISYSQYRSWNDPKSFHLGVKGKYEYMLDYFFDEDFPDMGWAQFGEEVEGYICQRSFSEAFSPEEKKVLETIEPLGLFQHEFFLRFDGFGLLGFIDDAKEDFSHIRDYKTCSKSSSKKYYKDDYYQLDIYAMWVQQNFGHLPETLEVMMIERTGNPFKGGGRSVLKVGEQVWSHYRETSQERINFLREDIRRTAEEIAVTWEVFQKMLKL